MTTKKAKTKKSAPKKAAPKKAAPKKAAPKKVAPKKAAPKKVAPKKVAPKKVAPKKVAPKKVAPKKVAPKKVAVSEVAAVEVAAKKAPLTKREKQLLEIRDILLAQKNDILVEAENAMNALPEQTVFPDLGDQASAETDRNFMLRLRGREQRLLNKIEEAIERIDSGNFGRCDACGEDITVARLKARPVATLCIECKLEQEEEEKLKGD